MSTLIKFYKKNSILINILLTVILIGYFEYILINSEFKNLLSIETFHVIGIVIILIVLLNHIYVLTNRINSYVKRNLLKEDKRFYFDLEKMEIAGEPYSVKLENIVKELCESLSNLQYLNADTIANIEDLRSITLLSNNLKSIFENQEICPSRKIDISKIIIEALNELLKSQINIDKNYEIINSAKNQSNQLIFKMFNIFSIHNIPNNILEKNKSIIILGRARSGKSTMLNQLLASDSNETLLINQDKSNFHNFDKQSYESDIQLFENALNKSNIYLDDVHPDLKEELICKFFDSGASNTNKLVVTIQSLDDFKNISLIKKFDLVLISNSNSISKYKDLIQVEDLERILQSMSNYTNVFMSCNINKEVQQ